MKLHVSGAYRRRADQMSSKSPVAPLTWSDVWQATRSYKITWFDVMTVVVAIAVSILYSILYAGWLGMIIGPLMFLLGWMTVEFLF